MKTLRIIQKLSDEACPACGRKDRWNPTAIRGTDAVKIHCDCREGQLMLVFEK